MESNKHIEKILELLYSGEPANDLLAFEIIKQLDDSSAFRFPLMGLFFCNTLKLNSSWDEVFEFLKTTLNEKQKQALRNAAELDITTRGIRIKRLETNLSRFEISQIVYFLVKRKKSSPRIYLCFSNEGDSKRREMIDLWFHQIYITKEIRGFDRYDLSILYPDEIERFVKKVLRGLSSGELIDDLNYEFRLDLKRWNELPPIIQKLNRVDVIVYEGNYRGINYFPKFLFLFKNLNRLSIHLSTECDLPTDWHGMNSLKTLVLTYDEGCTISDFNFLATLPNLKDVVFIGSDFEISHPEIFLQAKHVNIGLTKSGSSRNSNYLTFSSTKGYSIHPNLKKESWLKFSIALKKSNLSYQKQIKYLKKISACEDASDTSILSINELKELLEGNAIWLSKKPSTKEIRIGWNSYNMNRYGEQYLDELIKQLKDKQN